VQLLEKNETRTARDRLEDSSLAGVEIRRGASVIGLLHECDGERGPRHDANLRKQCIQVCVID
jgi:hypothetical protein